MVAHACAHAAVDLGQDLRQDSAALDVAQVAEESGKEGVSGSVGLNTHYRNLEDARKKRQRARRVEAMSLKLAGVSTAQIAERMGIKPDTVHAAILASGRGTCTPTLVPVRQNNASCQR
jgi:hypothetical protein